MARWLSLLLVLGFSTLSGEEKNTRKLDSFKIGIPSFVIGPVNVEFDGSTLTVVGSRKNFTKKLSSIEIEKLQNSIKGVPLEKWSQFWLNDGYLDGYLIFANLSIDGKKYHFEGMNGCPPGFGKLADSIQAIAGKTNHLNHWTDSERNSKQIKGTFESWSDDLEKQLEQKLQKREQEEKEAEKEKAQESKNPTDCSAGF